MKTLAVLFLFSFPALALADGIDFLPGGLQFAPLRTNLQEPRVGVFKFSNSSNMKVDIGNSIDLLGLNVPSSALRFTAGIDFMAYALVTGTQSSRLQVDAIDGFFGGNLTASKDLDGQMIQARLRILHHSAHLVDGDYVNGEWQNDRGPIPYTRDLGEITAAHVLQASPGTLRSYAGLSYATLVRPADVRRFECFAGGETYFDKILGSVLDQPTNVFITYQISLSGTPAYTATNEIHLGVKLGRWLAKGPAIYLAYYSGRNMFAEYFEQKTTTIGAGFTVDFY